ncbi:DUF192 domain-containing protein [Profundibacter sp.]
MIKRRVLIAILALCASTVQASETCSPDAVDLRGDWGQAHFSVEVADDAQEQQKGLMFREKMSASAGMLFVYKRPHRARFWMKNTLIPLDMIFLDKTGRVTRIAENAKPLDETPIDGGDNVLMILEINGGMARGLGITVGSELRHPAFDSAIAAWPCPAE